MYQGCFILKRVNLLNKLSERFYPEANALSFDWIKAGPVLRKTCFSCYLRFVTGLFLYLPKTENISFSDVFRWYGKKLVACYG